MASGAGFPKRLLQAHQGKARKGKAQKVNGMSFLVSQEESSATEHIDPRLHDLDLRSTTEILQLLQASQQCAVDAVAQAAPDLERAVSSAAARLRGGKQGKQEYAGSLEGERAGRLVLVGAGASGRLAVQDGAELWPTYGWPHERLLLCMAGGKSALIRSVEGSEDDGGDARRQVAHHDISMRDVVVAVAASGTSAWTCAWLEAAGNAGALTIGIANNPGSTLLALADCPITLASGAEVLAGSTRMAAGTAQKMALNLFSTALMVRLNRTYGNLMVDMAAVNRKLEGRRIRLLQGVLPGTEEHAAAAALDVSDGWVKLAALVVRGCTVSEGRQLLDLHDGSLRCALASLR